MKYQILRLVDGGFVTVDDDDYHEHNLGADKWQCRHNQTGTTSIERVGDSRMLHKLLYPLATTIAQLIFINEDRFDYRKCNVKIDRTLRVPVKTGRGVKAKPRVKYVGNKFGIIGSMATIGPSSIEGRRPECLLCATVSYCFEFIQPYDNCLYFAAIGNWTSWKILEPGPLCTEMRRILHERANVEEGDRQRRGTEPADVFDCEYTIPEDNKANGACGGFLPAPK